MYIHLHSIQTDLRAVARAPLQPLRGHIESMDPAAAGSHEEALASVPQRVLSNAGLRV